MSSIYDFEGTFAEALRDIIRRQADPDPESTLLYLMKAGRIVQEEIAKATKFKDMITDEMVMYDKVQNDVKALYDRTDALNKRFDVINERINNICTILR